MLDPLLERIVARIDQMGAAGDDAGLPITLYVAGHVITGRLISAAAYFASAAQSYQAPQVEQPAVSARVRAGLARLLDDSGRAAAQEGRRENYAPSVLHLADASYSYLASDGSPVQVPVGGGGLWRGHLDHVDGFSFGELGQGRSQSGQALSY